MEETLTYHYRLQHEKPSCESQRVSLGAALIRMKVANLLVLLRLRTLASSIVSTWTYEAVQATCISGGHDCNFGGVEFQYLVIKDECSIVPNFRSFH